MAIGADVTVPRAGLFLAPIKPHTASRVTVLVLQVIGAATELLVRLLFGAAPAGPSDGRKSTVDTLCCRGSPTRPEGLVSLRGADRVSVVRCAKTPRSRHPRRAH
jgi:hypothetical protein